MSFDSKNLKKLDDLGKKLSITSQPIIESSNLEKRSSSKLHPVETEKDPQKLFKELVKASPNGEVPSHLIKRLKELEEKQLTHNGIIDANDSNAKINNKQSSQSDLYTSFQMLLLEED